LATAFDPNVPTVFVLNPATTVFAGGTYAFNLSVADSSGVSKVGFRTTGAGINRADSTVYSDPVPQADTAGFQISVPTSAPIGQTFTVTPFAENRDGNRTSGKALTVRIVAAGTDELAPLVYQTVPQRLETPDSLDVLARDIDGLVRIVGFIAKDQAGIIQHREADTLARVSRCHAGSRSMLRLRCAAGALHHRVRHRRRWPHRVRGASRLNVPVAPTRRQRDPVMCAYGLTIRCPGASADIAVDGVRRTVYVSNINRNQLEGLDVQQHAVAAPGRFRWRDAVGHDRRQLGSLLSWRIRAVRTSQSQPAPAA
jgi:hypothetical protein